MTLASTAKASKLCAGLRTDRAKVATIVGFITRTMLYDHLKAKTVTRRYRPNPDDTLATKKGICWDFATLAHTMLKSQGINCRLVIGCADDRYHAWNEVRLDNAWQRIDVTGEITGIKAVVYKAERRS